jgi:hypothetical protein
MNKQIKISYSTNHGRIPNVKFPINREVIRSLTTQDLKLILAGVNTITEIPTEGGSVSC